MQDPNEFSPIIAPGNDLALRASLWKPAGAGKVALTSDDGLATGYLAASSVATTPIDPVLTVDVDWLDDAKHPEWWSVVFNNSPTKDAALVAAFGGNAEPFLIVVHPAGCRAVLALQYSADLYFTLQ
jgi:hypothetical protein